MVTFGRVPPSIVIIPVDFTSIAPTVDEMVLPLRIGLADPLNVRVLGPRLMSFPSAFWSVPVLLPSEPSTVGPLMLIVPPTSGPDELMSPDCRVPEISSVPEALFTARTENC